MALMLAANTLYGMANIVGKLSDFTSRLEDRLMDAACMLQDEALFREHSNRIQLKHKDGSFENLTFNTKQEVGNAWHRILRSATDLEWMKAWGEGEEPQLFRFRTGKAAVLA